MSTINVQCTAPPTFMGQWIMARIGYARVSTHDQNPDHQLDALTAAGCDRVFVDKASGKLARRPELDACLDYLRPGDQLIITRLSRLSRSINNLVEQSAWLREHEVDLVVLLQGIDTTTPQGRLVFHILASIDEFHRELIVEGTRDGLAAARARGRTGGRKPKITPAKLATARELRDRGEKTMQQIAEIVGVSRGTLYRHLSEDTQ